VNVTAPGPVPQAEYARTLARVLRRPAIVPAPAFAVRLALGEFSGEVLNGARVLPRRLTGSGYAFRHAELEPALRDVLAQGAGS
jgi:NAD dependent epimerase/dehydratase family enzyme